ADAFQDFGRRALDCEIGVMGKLRKLHKRAGNSGLVEPRFRLRNIARRRARERKPGQPVRKPPGDRTPDATEARNADSGLVHAYSGLMLAARITLAHFAVSSAMSVPKAAGVSANAVPPKSAKRALIFGSASAAAISLLS